MPDDLRWLVEPSRSVPGTPRPEIDFSAFGADLRRRLKRNKASSAGIAWETGVPEGVVDRAIIGGGNIKVGDFLALCEWLRSHPMRYLNLGRKQQRLKMEDKMMSAHSRKPKAPTVPNSVNLPRLAFCVIDGKPYVTKLGNVRQNQQWMDGLVAGGIDDESPRGFYIASHTDPLMLWYRGRGSKEFVCKSTVSKSITDLTTMMALPPETEVYSGGLRSFFTDNVLIGAQLIGTIKDLLEDR